MEQDITKKGIEYIVNPLNEFISKTSVFEMITDEKFCVHNGEDETGYRFKKQDINVKIGIKGSKNLYISVALEPKDRVGIYWGIVNKNDRCPQKPYEELVHLLDAKFHESIKENDNSDWIWSQKIKPIDNGERWNSFMKQFWESLNQEFADGIIKKLQMVSSDEKAKKLLIELGNL